jgi:hypothetical protein
VVEHRIVLMDGAEKVVRLPGSDAVTAADLRDAVAGLVRSLCADETSRRFLF